VLTSSPRHHRTARSTSATYFVFADSEKSLT
jgi:hypothetical protein